jgi:hypothetical protein
VSFKRHSSSQEHDTGVARAKPVRKGPAVGMRPGDVPLASSGERRPKKRRDGVGGRADLCYDPTTGFKIKR